MNIYKTYEVLEGKTTCSGLKEYEYVIREAGYGKGAFNTDGLMIKISNPLSTHPVCTFCLMGKNLSERFMEEMRVSNPENLVGRMVKGFNSQKIPGLWGISPRD